jgi:hypothetical protein
MTDCHSTCAAIRAADSEVEVVTLVRNYLGSLGAEKEAILPASVVALGSHAREIAQAAVEVATREAQLAAEGPHATLLKEIGLVLSTAAMRLVVLGCGEQETAEG